MRNYSWSYCCAVTVLLFCSHMELFLVLLLCCYCLIILFSHGIIPGLTVVLLLSYYSVLTWNYSWSYCCAVTVLLFCSHMELFLVLLLCCYCLIILFSHEIIPGLTVVLLLSYYSVLTWNYSWSYCCTLAIFIVCLLAQYMLVILQLLGII